MSTHVEIDQSLTLPCGAIIRNRLMKSAMSEQLGDKHHNPKPGLETLYRTWAEGGLGIAVTGNIMIDRSALGEPANVVLDEQSDLEAFRRWSSAGKMGGCAIWAQLNHPGKQIPNFLVKTPVAPSAIPLGGGLAKGFNEPRALQDAEVRDIVQRFAQAASLAKQTGFDGVQIHGAHGYLVSQFLSPRHNQRDDYWGGDADRRMNFVREVYTAMRAAVGADYPVGIKLNSADFMKDGFSEEESSAVVKELEQLGIDLIEVSGGTYESPSMMGHKLTESTIKREAYFLSYAESLREVVKTPLVVTGGFRSSAAMRDAISSGTTDMVGLARPLAVVPDMPNRVLADPNYRMTLPEPTTGKPKIDRMVMLGLTWFETQIHRIAKGKSPDENLSAWRTVFDTLLASGWSAFKQRRA
ncbi:NADH:flavin oxidoreductase/NADH oxidase family protein [Cocleimonas flava]|uniref:2,4-dienoyl-CoA reductase-like NADH-dependent reductase (Old Yellow Enzyme family) n=1 Tax=Cocleimonas flava TaxID=634765 RepID=A0A4R1F6G6_9GAMM|nr:NADH:flavin oxidoreductase/NADH oxidase family protein [Cocleimonas flava]TCJ87518.1 2,4-dienoyl-CoA reductase-like NADH-dependent reductase (Old Yellow Enzyme family) [Cocleimonas flava]